MFQEIDGYDTYLEALIRGDRTTCVDFVSALLETDIDVKSLYTDLFQRSLYDIGHLWACNKISVDVEHYATAITERLFHLVYPRIFMAEHIGKSAIVCCSANEFHQIGGKMVADILEMNGWDTSFLGASTTLQQLQKAVQEDAPDLLALSLSLSSNFPILAATVQEIHSSHPKLPIIVGGQGLLHIDHQAVTSLSNVTLITSLYELEAYVK